MIWYIFGVLSLVYYAVLRILSQGQQFVGVWLVLAAVFVLAGLWRLYRKKHPKLHIALWFRTFCVTSLILAAILFGVVIGRIVTAMPGTAEKKLDYIVILCQSELYGETDEELRDRMEAALSYMEQDPDLKAIVTGGWNAASGSAPAHYMYQFLVEHGIRVNRIYWENHTGGSDENLIHVKSIVGVPEHGIGIVTSNYFSYRLSRIANQVGVRDFQMIPIATSWWLLPHRVVVEFLNIFYNKLMLR